jgi:hypothetical protein
VQHTLVEVAPPRLLTLSLRDLSAATRPLLVREFRKGTAHRIDLFTHDTARAAERLRAACKERGVRLIADAVAQEGVKQKLQQSYILFSDELRPEDWERLLRGLGTADKAAEEKRAGDGIFFKMVLVPLSEVHHKELSSLTGLDLSSLAAPAARPPATVTTAEKTALLLPPLPAAGSARAHIPSREVKQAVDARHDRPAGAVAVMLVLRQAIP